LENKSDIDVRNTIVVRYLPSVEIIAKILFRHLKGKVELDDLIANGTFGLIESIEKFDLNRKCPFESFCKMRVYGAMIDAVRKLDWVPRLERKKQKENQLEHDIPQIISLATKSYNESEKPIEISDEVEHKTASKPENRIMRIAWLQEMLVGLNQTERLVIILYYYDKETMKRIGEVLNLSETRISQLHKYIIKRLQTTKEPNEFVIETDSEAIPLELKPEDYELYIKIKKQLGHQIDYNNLSYTPKNSFIIEPKQSETKKEKNMGFYTTKTTAQKLNIKWQFLCAMMRSGAIPEAVLDGNRFKDSFVEEIAQSTERFQELLQKHKELSRSKKTKPYITITNDTMKTTPTPTSTPINPKNHLILSALKNMIQNIETENQNLSGFAVKHTLKDKNDNYEIYDLLITLSIEVKTK
jgi:RNA polymerase sigma factor for flagellar operon FliA